MNMYAQVWGSIVKQQGKISATALAALLAFSTYALAIDSNALPIGGQVTAGSGSISQTGSQMIVDQASQRMIADWTSFDIGRDASVRFNQPNSAATALNRVQSQSPSQIFGSLSANGQVYLLNPAGIIFGQTAQVNVGGLVASSLALSNENFLAGNSQYENAGSAGAVLNQGNIRTDAGGYVAFLAPKVGNEGTISAPQGTVVLAAGDKVSLDFAGDQLVTYSVDQGAVDALAENHGLIRANGGLVIMTAEAADRLTGAVVNNDGVIQAQTLENREGRILLLADMDGGTTVVAGTLDASAPNGGDGGFIETSAASVQVADSANVTTRAASGKAGIWLIDPTNYTIMTGGDISPAALASALTAGNVVIQTADEGTQMGHIYIHEAINWSSVNDLTLNAHGDVTSYVPISNNAGGSLTLRADLDGNGSGSLYFGGDASISLTGGGRADLYYNPTSYAAPTDFSAVMGSTPYTAWMLVNNVTQLQAMNTNLGGSYALGRDIDASATVDWDNGAGFAPVSMFSGGFDGLDHTISGLTINRPAQDYVGLFGWVGSGSSVRNVGLLGGNVAGNWYAGSLTGVNYFGSIGNSYSTGGVTGSYYAGGLVGFNSGSINDSYTVGSVSGINAGSGGLTGYNSGAINNSTAGGSVIGMSEVGGLVGRNERGSINASHATGSVAGTGSYIGGLVGLNNNGTTSGSYAPISNSYATGNVSGGDNIGGLVGHNNYAPMTNVYATGNVSGNIAVGGLAGSNYGQITNAYSIGSATGNQYVGGLAGYNNNYGILDKTYATGIVTLLGGGDYAGGLVGWTYYGSRIYNSYWDTQSTGQAMAIGLNWGNNTVTGLTTAQMMQPANMPGLDFTNTWWLSQDNTRPFLRSEYSSSITNAHQLQLMALNLGASYTLAADIDMAELTNPAGMWNITTGFVPIGDNASMFTGQLDGQNHTISNLIINRPAQNYVGLFGFAGNGSVLRNIGLVGGNVAGNYGVGQLLGYHYSGGTIENIYATGRVSGGEVSGGLVGYNNGNVSSSYTTGGVSGVWYAGGLVGVNDNSNGVINNSYATGNVSGFGRVGGLVGVNAYSASISNSYATGNVNGTDLVGGLVGYNLASATIDTVYASGGVTGDNQVGGLVGHNDAIISRAYASGNVAASSDYAGGLAGYSTGPLSDVYATGSVSGNYQVGGLVGENYGNISNAYATGTVVGSAAGIGGLVGKNYGASIGNAFATGNVSGNTYIGGFTGYNTGNISDAYATGSVTALYYVGGFAGWNEGTISRVYASGAVTGSGNTGGAVGVNYGGLNNSFWDTVASGTLVGVGTGSNSATGLSTEEMMSMPHFLSWDIADAGGTSAIWRIYEGNTYPLLRTFLAPLTISADNVTKTYDGTAWSGSLQNADYAGADTGKIFSLANAYGPGAGKNAGSYEPRLYSNQQGYDIRYTNGILTIDPAALTVTANNDSKTYDGLVYNGGNGVVYDGFITGEDAMVLGGVLSYGGSSQGAVNAGAYSIAPSGLSSGNYAITFNDGTLTVDSAALTVTANDDAKTYNGLAYRGGNGVTYSGFAAGEDQTVLDGVLTFDGTSQGAVLPGVYTIFPGGLDSRNYDIMYLEGALTIENDHGSIERVLASLVSTQSGINGTYYDPAAYVFEPANRGYLLEHGSSGPSLEERDSPLVTVTACVDSLRDTVFCH